MKALSKKYSSGVLQLFNRPGRVAVPAGRGPSITGKRGFFLAVYVTVSAGGYPLLMKKDRLAFGTSDNGRITGPKSETNQKS